MAYQTLVFMKRWYERLECFLHQLILHALGLQWSLEVALALPWKHENIFHPYVLHVFNPP
jgi:hypothetical protein